jgi:hypothetical protein
MQRQLHLKSCGQLVLTMWRKPKAKRNLINSQWLENLKLRTQDYLPTIELPDPIPGAKANYHAGTGW